MDPKPPDSLRPRVPFRERGFIRFELYLLAALVLLALALVVPRLLRGEGKGALLALLGLIGAVLAIFAVLWLITWLGQELDRPGAGWRDRAFRAVGHLLRFLLFGFIGAVVATALAGNHRLGARGENLAALVAGALAGAGGLALFHRLGKARFWPAFGWFALALLGAFLGGILGILGPEPWGIDAGILLPLVLFLVLALLGRIAPRPQGNPSDPPAVP